MSRLAWLWGASAFLFACTGIEDPLGRSEPILVHGAHFKNGKLPDARGGAADDLPSITFFEIGTGNLGPTAQGVPLRGGASLSAYSVGMRLLDQGTGYWVFPVDGEDPLMLGTLEWSVSLDMGFDVEPGRQTLGLVAFDETGKPGPQTVVDVCVRADIPDNGNVCDATREPPEAIATLRWNADVDMDLIVVAPDGTRYGRLNYGAYEEGAPLWTLDADGAATCVADGRRIENFVWHRRPERGSWYIYANLFDACGLPGVRFELTTYRKKVHDDGTFSLEAERVVVGDLIRAQTKAEDTTPLYLTRFNF